MLRLLKWLFAGRTKQLMIEGFWCNTSVKLPYKLRTPLGGNITLVTVCVDIKYSVDSDEINITTVQLSSSSSFGNKTFINMASTRTGEAWCASSVRPKSLLFEVVKKELKSKRSRLRRIMLNKWRAVNRSIAMQNIVNAINQKATSDEIKELDMSLVYGIDLVFKYTKPKTSPERRYVTVIDVKGNIIRARDHKDDKIKSFKIDRISKVRMSKED